MFKKIIRFIFAKRIQKSLNITEREHKFVNYKNARTVIILFESDFSEKNPEIRSIIKTLKSDGKKVMAWGYVNKKEIKTAILPDFRILHQKDSDFLQKPQPTFMHELENLEFDLLIDLTKGDIIPLLYIGHYARALCKTGVKLKDIQLYDFIIDLDKNSVDTDGNVYELDATFIYNQIIFYLKSIQTTD